MISRIKWLPFIEYLSFCLPLLGSFNGPTLKYPTDLKWAQAPHPEILHVKNTDKLLSPILCL